MICRDCLTGCTHSNRICTDGFTHPAENVEDTVDELRMNPLIPKDVPIHGLIFHPRTGEIEVIVNGYTQMKQYYEK